MTLHQAQGALIFVLALCQFAAAHAQTERDALLAQTQLGPAYAYASPYDEPILRLGGIYVRLWGIAAKPNIRPVLNDIIFAEKVSCWTAVALHEPVPAICSTARTPDIAAELIKRGAATTDLQSPEIRRYR